MTETEKETEPDNNFGDTGAGPDTDDETEDTETEE